MTKGETNSITYIAVGTDPDKVKAFILELGEKINEYNRIIKGYKKDIDKQTQNKIYDFAKYQIKKAKRELRSIKVKFMFNEKYSSFLDIIQINHIVLHMLTVEKLISEITEEKIKKVNKDNEDNNFVEEKIFDINRKCSEAFEKAEESLTSGKELSQSYEQAYVYLKSIRHLVNSKMENLKEQIESINGNSRTNEYLLIEFEESEFWITQMENWENTILKQVISDIG